MDLKKSQAIVLGEDDYQELELWYPVLRFREQGVAVDIIAPNASDTYRSALGYPLMPNGGPAGVGEIDVVVIPGQGAAKRLRDDESVPHWSLISTLEAASSRPSAPGWTLSPPLASTSSRTG
jgi:putative intracellular protease/amidase